VPDHRGYLLPDERRILLQHYAPVLVLFPESAHQAPYPDDGDAIYTMRGSYHPRAVSFFLKHAKVRYARHLLLFRLSLLWNPRSYDEEVSAIEQSITPGDVDDMLESHWSDPRFAGLDDKALRTAVFRHLVQHRLGRRIRGFDQPLYHARNVDYWKLYFKFLADDDVETTRSVIYGRLIQGRASLNVGISAKEAVLQEGPGYGPYDVSRTRVALQYWFHYYYDDWANRHEGDWEGITLLLELDEAMIRQACKLDEAELLAGVAVKDVGYAVHEEGYRRQWQDVQRTRDGRPIVYVSRGSSASYFEWRLTGYPASARVGIVEKAATLPGIFLRGWRVLGRRWDTVYSARFVGRDPKTTDWVAADPTPADRLDLAANTLEQSLPCVCRGVRRRPAFDSEAGYDDASYYLETDNLFWLEMVQEHGVQWGEDSLFPGTKGPGGITQAEWGKERQMIHELAKLETNIERALDALSGIPFVAEHAIPELNRALERLRPRNLSREGCFPRRVRLHVYTMWAWILKDHPEAWHGGPGIYLRLMFRGILYPGPLRFLLTRPDPEPLLKREDPMYHLKSLSAQIRRMRYETQHKGARWDNPFAWVRYICRADTFYYGTTHTQAPDTEELLSQLDCMDTVMSVE